MTALESCSDRTSAGRRSSCPYESAGYSPNPFALFRAAAGVIAHDLAKTPSTGVRVLLDRYRLENFVIVFGGHEARAATISMAASCAT